jgi:hypothetical protein
MRLDNAYGMLTVKRRQLSFSGHFLEIIPLAALPRMPTLWSGTISVSLGAKTEAECN